MEGFKKDDLEHYGLKGMKWGERRFQNKDGSLTPAGRQRYLVGQKQFNKQLRQDKQKAYALTDSMRITSRADRYARQDATKRAEKFQKKPTYKNAVKAAAAMNTESRLRNMQYDTMNKSDQHMKELQSRYGKEHVKGYDYDKQTGIIDKKSAGRTVASIATSVACNVGSVFLGSTVAKLMDSPIFYAQLMVPKTENTRARDTYGKMYREEVKKLKKSPIADWNPELTKAFNK